VGSSETLFAVYLVRLVHSPRKTPRGDACRCNAVGFFVKRRMTVVAGVHIFPVILIDHSNEVLSVLAELGIAAHLHNMLGWPACRRCQIIAKECLSMVQHENVRSGNDNENRERPVDSLTLDSAYCTYDARILSRPISFATGGVTGDLLEIGQT
jgi:hypothetical protein